MEESSSFSTSGNPSLPHQEVVSYVVYGTPTKEISSITAAIIKAEDYSNLASKIKITKEEGSEYFSTTYVEEALSETLKSYANSSTKYMPQNIKSTMMTSSKIRNYHIRGILYNIYKYNISQNKK